MGTTVGHDRGDDEAWPILRTLAWTGRSCLVSWKATGRGRPPAV